MLSAGEVAFTFALMNFLNEMGTYESRHSLRRHKVKRKIIIKMFIVNRAL